MSRARATAPVVIVGAGPVGLLLACELRQARVDVVVVERLPAATTESRASQLTTLTAQLLHERGFDALLAEAVHEPRAHFGGLGFALADLPGAGAYQGHWKVPQYRTEHHLGQRAAQQGVTLLRAHELTGIHQEPDTLVCTLNGPAGPVTLRAAYLVGCDGANSTVRRLAAFPTTRTPATRTLLRADIGRLHIRDRRFERLPGGFAVASTRAGVTRVMVHALGTGPRPPGTPPTFDDVTRTWQQVTGEDISAGHPLWLDAFDDAKGQADHYRRGRILLAGDAAHWHPPVGGQALNLGLQDAVDLAGKLAATAQGRADDSLLDTYHDRRHPVAARVLHHVAAQEQLMFGGPPAEPLRAVLSELTALDQVRTHLTAVASNLDHQFLQVRRGGREDSATLRH
ncbi:FAD-dependent monooxygenase [Streptomyces sp. NPDC001904]|uniref:FAD-dependent monooxygenase n=1 Tax=Streptomyces sp. NPDC001904 TaxID=3154531 RepID=UPI00331C8724